MLFFSSFVAVLFVFDIFLRLFFCRDIVFIADDDDEVLSVEVLLFSSILVVDN